jgi:UPF0716 protein FxsA
MNSLFILILGLPVLEILVMIELGAKIGGLNTIFLIILTAVIGLFMARVQGLNTIRSGLLNIYKNKTPIYELISGATIAFAALLLIIPGFITDTFGFLLLVPISRKLIISFIFKNKISQASKSDSKTIEAEIIEDSKKDES